MQEAKILTELITKVGKTKKCYCRTLFSQVRKTLSQTEKLLRHQMEELEKRDETVAKWLYENYYRLEETAKNDVLSVKRVKLLCSCRKIPVVYSFFDYVLENTTKLSKEDICEILRLCNE